MYKLDTPFSAKQIYLKSQNAQIRSGENTDCVFFFQNNPISVNPNVSILISIVDCQIPVSFYTITVNNNTLKYSINSADQTDIVIPPGNYTTETLRTYLNQNFNGITVEYISSTNKYRFSHGSNAFVIKSESTCLKFLGLSDVDHSSLNNAVTSDKTIDLSGVTAVYVDSNFMTQNLDSANQVSSILAKIPVNAGSDAIQFYTNKTGYKSEIQLKTISTIRIRLIDQDSNLIDLNGAHWQMTLQCDFRYTRNEKPILQKSIRLPSRIKIDRAKIKSDK